jgi:hypothetical protein
MSSTYENQWRGLRVAVECNFLKIFCRKVGDHRRKWWRCNQFVRRAGLPCRRETEVRIWRKYLDTLLKTSTFEARGLPNRRLGEKRQDIEAANDIRRSSRTQTVCGRILSSFSHDADCLESQADLPYILTSSRWAQILSTLSSTTAFSPFTGSNLGTALPTTVTLPQSARFSAIRCRKHVPPKRRQIPASLYGVVSQNTATYEL